MKLYKYLTPERIDVLENQAIRFTQPVLLNDPFELAPCIKGIVEPGRESELLALLGRLTEAEYDALMRELQAVTGIDLAAVVPYKAITAQSPEVLAQTVENTSAVLRAHYYAHVREYIGRIVGILSLSERPDNLLMWAHYADCHKGLVVEFDTDHAFFQQGFHEYVATRALNIVQYSRERPEVALFDPAQPAAALVASLGRHFLLTKSEDWEYENEWRMLLPVDRAAKRVQVAGAELCLFALEPACITRVIAGAKMTAHDRSRLARVTGEDRYAHVRLCQATIHPRLFRVNVDSVFPS